MAGPIRFKIAITGLTEMKRKATEGILIAPPWHAAMEEIGAYGRTLAKGAAPRGPSSNGHVGGLTSEKFTMRLQARPLPMWVKIETNATRPRPGHGNYAYPKRVEWDPKLHHAGWLRGVFVQIKSRFASTLERTAREIETIWA